MQKRAGSTPKQAAVASRRPAFCRGRTEDQRVSCAIDQAEYEVQAPVHATRVDLAHGDLPFFIEPSSAIARDPLQPLNSAHCGVAGEFLPFAVLDASVIVELDVPAVPDVGWSSPKVLPRKIGCRHREALVPEMIIWAKYG